MHQIDAGAKAILTKWTKVEAEFDQFYLAEPINCVFIEIGNRARNTGIVNLVFGDID